jgi:signal transduction histidine kinase
MIDDDQGHAARHVVAGTPGDATLADALRASEAKYRTLFDSIDEGFCLVEMICDEAGEPRDCRIVETNPAFSRHSPLRVGDGVRGWTPGEELDWLAVYARVLRTGEPLRWERFSERVGRWFTVYVSRVGGEGSRQLAVVFNDITEMKTAERELRDAARRKDEFLAVLAHELRNPLAPIRSATQFLRLVQLPEPEMRRPVEMIDRQVALMTRLIDDLLDVARITRGIVELQPECVAFTDVARVAAELAAADIEARGHTLVTDWAAAHVVIQADRHRLAQVFGNLLANAARYTPAGGRITFAAHVDGDALEAAVGDNGIGIPSAKLGEIFEMFTQLHPSRERQGGLGIGLTIARQLVELHRGTIEARSEGEGRGSTFVVRLPISVATAVRRIP